MNKSVHEMFSHITFALILGISEPPCCGGGCGGSERLSNMPKRTQPSWLLILNERISAELGLKAGVLWSLDYGLGGDKISEVMLSQIINSLENYTE